jgi:hypothetical protein
VEDSAIRAEIRALRPRYESVARGMDPAEAEKQLRDWSCENIIERVLLRQEAQKDGEGELEARIERLLEKITSKVSPPRHKDVTEYYRKNKQQFFTPEGPSSFEQVREAIETGLHQRKKERAVENFLDHLRAKATVVEI